MDIFFIIALFATSIIAVTFIVERAVALRRPKIIPTAVERAVENYQSSADLQQLRRTCDYYPSTVGRLLLFLSDHLDWPKGENTDLLETRARHEVVKLERGLVILEIIVGIAPLLGLVGTIYGLIVLFGSMGNAAGVDNAKFALGISYALYATLGGLLIAIPALIAWSYYSKKVENLAVEMETLCDEFLRKHYRTSTTEAVAPRIIPAPPVEAFPAPPVVSSAPPITEPAPPITAQRPTRKAR